MSRAGLLFAACLLFSACAREGAAVVCASCRGSPATYPPYRGKLPVPRTFAAQLPPDPGYGFLYTRVVYGFENDTSYAYIVHVGDLGPQLLAIVGPIKETTEYTTFFVNLAKTYTSHCPGAGGCCAFEAKAAPPRLTPATPPRPPPPSGGSMVAYTSQTGPVAPGDPQIAGDTVGAAAAGVAALNGN